MSNVQFWHLSEFLISLFIFSHQIKEFSFQLTAYWKEALGFEVESLDRGHEIFGWRDCGVQWM